MQTSKRRPLHKRNGWYVVNKNKRGKVLGSVIWENLYILQIVGLRTALPILLILNILLGTMGIEYVIVVLDGASNV